MMLASSIPWNLIAAIGIPSIATLLAAALSSYFWHQDTRPRVYVSMHHVNSQESHVFVARNAGRTPAFDVNIELRPYGQGEDRIRNLQWIYMILPGDSMRVGEGQQSLQQLSGRWHHIDVHIYYNRKAVKREPNPDKRSHQMPLRSHYNSKIMTWKPNPDKPLRSRLSLLLLRLLRLLTTLLPNRPGYLRSQYKEYYRLNQFSDDVTGWPVLKVDVLGDGLIREEEEDGTIRLRISNEDGTETTLEGESAVAYQKRLGYGAVLQRDENNQPVKTGL